jgi:hypothetical protein
MFVCTVQACGAPERSGRHDVRRFAMLQVRAGWLRRPPLQQARDHAHAAPKGRRIQRKKSRVEGMPDGDIIVLGKDVVIEPLAQHRKRREVHAV